MSLGMMTLTSPTIPRSDTSKIAAESFLLIAITHSEFSIPAICWIAPDIPQAMYSLSDIARERENIAYDPETGESTILNSANENQSSAEMPKNSDDAMVSDFLKSKQKMLDYILQFAAEREWENEHDLDQNRALFTAWCFMFRIDADNPECDEVLKKIYRIAALQDLMPYEEFSIFMISLIN